MSTDLVIDTELRFRATVLTVDGFIFSRYSSVFAQDRTNIDVSAHCAIISEPAFHAFVDYCQSRTYSINPWNAYDLRYLATVFGVSELIPGYQALNQMSLVDFWSQNLS
jgi:hypothetical protein